MGLRIVRTTQEQLLSTPVEQALRSGLAERGSAVLLVPTFAQALSVQQELAEMQGLSLGVEVTTPLAWAKERWEVWGDGRALVDGTALIVLARDALRHASREELGPLELSRGLVSVLVQLVGTALPWLPGEAEGTVDAQACAQAGLTHAETRLVGLAITVGKSVRERGFVTEGEVLSALPAVLAEAGVAMPALVAAGFSKMERRMRAFFSGLGRADDLTLVSLVRPGAAFDQTRRYLDLLEVSEVVDDDSAAYLDAKRSPRLRALLDALYSDATLAVGAEEPVELLVASGPVAEAELVTRRVVDACGKGGPRAKVVVCVPDAQRARRELVPKLVRRGLGVRVQSSRPLLECPSAQAFFSFVHTVANLVELDATWPAPAQGMEGPVPQLGDMSWWPPRELSDFLLSDIAHLEAERGWWDDAKWRGNRLLTPATVLETLRSERDVSRSVAQATEELLRGRIGSAASKLLAPYVMQAQPQRDDASDEPRAVLQALITLAGTLASLGVTADPTREGAVSLAELGEVMEWAAEGMAVVTRSGFDGAPGAPTVHVMGTSAAASLPPCSIDTLVVCGQTTVEAPIPAGDDLLPALLELLAIEPKANPMAGARAAFWSLMATASRRVVLERATHDADSKVTYPSVMLSELLSVYGMATGESKEGGLLTTSRVETLLGENLSTDGRAPVPVGEDNPAPAGQLTQSSRSLVFVPREGRAELPNGKPVLSASQIETYLDCPYKWFSLRKLGLDTVDAGHGGMEMGTFAHRVLEVTHRELLAQALEAQAPGVVRDELLQAIEADPARHVEGSRVDERTLQKVREMLDHEFDLHREHMYMERKPRVSQQLLVAHDSVEESQERTLKRDLLSSLEFQTRILQGFEPRLFEWRFGAGDDLVEYAGAYFTGTVDRIDVSPHGTAVILDYKHKGVSGFANEYDALQEGVLEGTAVPRRVQSLIYAQVVRRAFEGRLRLVGTVYLATKSPHALAGAASENVVDLVFGKVSNQRLPRVSVPDAGNGMDGLLDRTEELVAEQVGQMMAGNIEARPRDKKSCDFCPVMQCERRMMR